MEQLFLDLVSLQNNYCNNDHIFYTNTKAVSKIIAKKKDLCRIFFAKCHTGQYPIIIIIIIIIIINIFIILFSICYRQKMSVKLILVSPRRIFILGRIFCYMSVN